MVENGCAVCFFAVSVEGDSCLSVSLVGKKGSRGEAVNGRKASCGVLEEHGDRKWGLYTNRLGLEN
jgi:hypothetical protein